MTGRSTRRSRLAGLVAAALAAAAGLVGAQAGAASAATCSTSGISALEDASHGAGGGTSTQCDAVSGSRTASSVFAGVGVTVRRNPDGSVCQVDGLPADAPCQRLGTQYWGLFWSNGRDGRWIYAQEGDQSLTIPANGAVAWVWQGSSGERQPGVAAPVVHAAPRPTPTPTPRPTRKPVAPSTGTPRSSVSAKPAPAAAGASSRPRARASAPVSPTSTPSSSSAATAATPSASASGTPAATAGNVGTALSSSPTHDGGLPAWVPVSVVVVLGAGIGGALWWRRRSGTA